MKPKTKDKIITYILIALLGASFGASTRATFESFRLEKENKALWSALYDNQERMNGLADFQREQAEVVIQIADKINGAIMVGISNKEVFEEMKRREAYISE